MNKVLVTGANGFIGQQLVKQLVASGAQVRALLRRPTSFDKVDCVFGDLTEPTTLQGICQDIKTVYHLAGLAHAWADNNNPTFTQKHMQVNYHGTENIFNEACLSGVKQFIYFSSVKAGSDSPYGQAKQKAEDFLLEKAKRTQMHVTILRPSLVYGPNWKGNLATMLRAIDKGFFVPLPETNNRRSMVSLEDLCQAAMLCAKHPEANGKIYYVTDGKDYSTRQLYVAMCQALGKKIPSWWVPRFIFYCLAKTGDLAQQILRRRLPFNSEAHDKLFGSSNYDSQLIQRELAFTPQYDLYSMLPTIVSVYKGK